MTGIGFLPGTVLILTVIVLTGFFNEKVTKLTYEISLLLFSSVLGGIVLLISAAVRGTTAGDILAGVSLLDLESFLMKGVLCFMLYAGSCHMKLRDFKRLARPVGVLAVLCTILGAVIYGGLFFLASGLMGLGLTFPVCLMFGSIVAPTDPIAATSILNRFGLPEDTGFIIEGESLLNDGVGVALFVCFSGMVTDSSKEGFFSVMFREIAGAVIIGILVTTVFFAIFKRTGDHRRRIFTSLLIVSMAYYLCELFSCSGAIASVVCGVLSSALRNQEESKGNRLELREFDDFWDVLDNLLNSVLYVALGLSFVRILQMRYVVILSLAAVICNLIGRSGSLYICTFLMGKIPDGFKRLDFVKLLTWGGLRGGLSIALAMSTASIVPEEIYHVILGCTYAIVFFTTVVQGLTMKRVYEGMAH